MQRQVQNDVATFSHGYAQWLKWPCGNGKNMRGAFGPTPRSRTPQVTANEDGCAAG